MKITQTKRITKGYRNGQLMLKIFTFPDGSTVSHHRSGRLMFSWGQELYHCSKQVAIRCFRLGGVPMDAVGFLS